MNRFVLESRSGALPSGWFNAICAIHDEVFLRPPFAWTPDTSRENADDLVRLAGDPTFGAVVARRDAEFVGYAYGHRLPADHGWWRAIPEPLPSGFTDEWDGRTFTLTGLAVLPVQPTALETQGFYHRLGWRKVGRNGPFPGTTPPRWDVYVLEGLPGPSPEL